ncbi:MAG: hypothetical protein IPJ98_06180 [Bryobacterales bacterium]|nr:hypothetical protein [Bryobacterales bacterium]
MQVTTMEKLLTPEETAAFAAQFEQQDRFARANRWDEVAGAVGRRDFPCAGLGSRK